MRMIFFLLEGLNYDYVQKKKEVVVKPKKIKMYTKLVKNTKDEAYVISGVLFVILARDLWSSMENCKRSNRDCRVKL